MIEFNAILYVTLLFLYLRKTRKFNLGAMLLSVYALSSIFSVVFYHSPSFGTTLEAGKQLTLEPFIYMFIALLIFFFPVLKFQERDIKQIRHPSELKMLTFAWAAVIFGIISTVVVIPHVIHGLSGDISENRDEVMSEGIVITTNPILNTIVYISRSIDKVSMLVFFYVLIFYRKNRMLKLLLLVPAFIFPLLFGLAWVARTGIIFSTFLFFTMFLLFRQFMQKRMERILVRCFIGVGIVLGLVFMTITVARFGDRKDTTDVNFFLYKYAGENFVNFNSMEYDKVRHPMEGNNCFPWFRKLLGLSSYESLEQKRTMGGFQTGIPIYLFYTFVGDLYLDFGDVATLFFLIVVSAVFFASVKSKRVTDFNVLILYTLLYSICMEGVFIFSYQTVNQSILITVGLYFYFKRPRKKNLFDQLPHQYSSLSSINKTV